MKNFPEKEVRVRKDGTPTRAAEPIEDDTILDLVPLDPEVVERAMLSGGRVAQLERERHVAVTRAQRALEGLLRKCATSGGGFRGQREGAVGGVRAIPVSGRPGKESVHIIVNTGELKNCRKPGDLQAAWNALPDILDRHIKACAALTKSVAAQRDAAMTVARNVQVVETLLDSNVPMSRKRELVQRVFQDSKVRDALTAAEATGEEGAVTKLVRDQVGDNYETPDDAVALISAFFEDTMERVLQNADGERLPDGIVCYRTTGAHALDWTINFSTCTVTPGLSSGAACTVALDFDLLYRALVKSDATSLIQAYFSGQMKIEGDPMEVVAIMQYFAEAQRAWGA
jgi:hypothetical protein